MIVAMDKVSLVVMDKEKENALEKLRELGVLHLERKQVQSEALSKLIERKNKTDTALALLRPAAEAQKKKKKGGDLPDAGKESPVDAVLSLGEEKKSLQEQLSSLVRERARIEKWGEFDPKAFAEFAEKGIILIPYELSLKSYTEFNAENKDAQVIVLSKDKTSVRLVAVGGELAGEAPFVLPEQPLSVIDARGAEIKTELEKIETSFTAFVPAINR
ncbi:MAG: V-type ATP synthase subunit I, partial [Spirochaetales bacterium]|nr:V-type ATP synthase subunit I [Spirochaetales bacterium]